MNMLPRACCVLVVAFLFTSPARSQYVANDDDWVIDYRTPTTYYVAQNDVPGSYFQFVTYPVNGSVIWHSLGVVAWTPQTITFTGSDSFSYKTCWVEQQQNVCSAPATVSIYVIGSSDDSQNNGSCRKHVAAPPPPSPNIGQPVNVTNGNMWLTQSDYYLPGIGENIEVERFYNSANQSGGIFGLGWTTKYDESLFIYDDRMIRLNLPDARGVILGRSNTSSPFKPVTNTFSGQLVKEQDGSYTLTLLDGNVHKFNTSGKLLWQRDRNGNQTTLSYNTNGVLTGITDAFGRTLTVTPNSNGKVEQISDSMGLVASYEYDPTGALLKTVTYSDGSKYNFNYTSKLIAGQTRMLLDTVKDALDNILEFHLYDDQGRAYTSEKHGGAEKYTLTFTSSYTTVTDGLGRVTKYNFTRKQGTNLVTSVEGTCGCGSGGSEASAYQYDNYNLNLIGKTDALGRQTTHEFFPDGNLKKQTDTFGTQEFTYNSFGQVLTYKDRMGGVWTNTFDSAGNLLTTKDPLNNVTTIEYPTTNNKGLPDSVKDARNNVTKFKWYTTGTQNGLLEEIEDPYQKKTKFTFDARGRVKTVTNALNHVTQYNYFDDTQRKIELVYPNLDKIVYKYDVRWLLESVTDERGKVTIYEFDTAYRLKKITDPLGHAKEFGYDLMSNMTSYKDPRGFVTQYVPDDFDRLKEIIYAAKELGATPLKERFEYDKIGRLRKHYDTANRLTEYNYDDVNRTNTVTNAELEVTTTKYNQRFQTIEVKDALNQVYTFSYDPFGRILSQTRAGATMSFEFDEVGNIKKRIDYAGRITNYTHDKLNRLTKIEYDNGAENPVAKTQATYGYDDISRLISAANEVGIVSFNYDNRNRIKNTTDVFGHLLEYEYERTATVNQKRLKFDGSMYAVYNFDDAGRLANIVNSGDSTTISFEYDNEDKLKKRIYPNGVETTYEYYDNDLIKRIKDATSTATLFDRQYGYNDALQISQITEPTQTRTFEFDDVDRLTNVWSSGNQLENYTFDDVGNRTASHLSSTYGYQTGQYNRLISTTTTNYTFDANGNRDSKAEGFTLWRYGWDQENRLTTASTRKQSVRYRYDALGRRVQRVVGSGREKPTRSIYDGEDVLVDKDVLDNTQTATFTKYLNGPGIDNKLRVQTGSSVNYFLADHLGSTNGLVDAAGAITSQTAYDSFGNATNTSFSSRYQFTGREYDSFSGLHYYRARFYDSNLGRFTSEDPIGFNAGDVNLYSYVLNNPTAYRDPSGKIIPIVAAGVVVGAGVAILLSPSYLNAPGLGDPVYDSRNDLVANTAMGIGAACLLNKASGAILGAGSRFFRTRTPIGTPADDIALVFKPFTRRNFRHNLGQQTGQIPPNAHAHHVFPDEFADDFARAGINHNNPKYGAWWESTNHLENAYRYNQEWRNFFRTDRTQQEILDFGRRIMNDYGIPISY